MVVVKIELWPGGYETNKRDLGTILIANDGTGTSTIGNYDVRVMSRGKKPRILKTGRVEGYKRKTTSPHRLVLAALQIAFNAR